MQIVVWHGYMSVQNADQWDKKEGIHDNARKDREEKVGRKE